MCKDSSLVNANEAIAGLKCIWPYSFFLNSIHSVGTCGLADQCWVHKQKVLGSSPITANMLCP